MPVACIKYNNCISERKYCCSEKESPKIDMLKSFQIHFINLPLLLSIGLFISLLLVLCHSKSKLHPLVVLVILHIYISTDRPDEFMCTKHGQILGEMTTIFEIQNLMV